jgi:hypothetical protein
MTLHQLKILHELHDSVRCLVSRLLRTLFNDNVQLQRLHEYQPSVHIAATCISVSPFQVIRWVIKLGCTRCKLHMYFKLLYSIMFHSLCLHVYSVSCKRSSTNSSVYTLSYTQYILYSDLLWYLYVISATVTRSPVADMLLLFINYYPAFTFFYRL